MVQVVAKWRILRKKILPIKSADLSAWSTTTKNQTQRSSRQNGRFYRDIMVWKMACRYRCSFALSADLSAWKLRTEILTQNLTMNGSTQRYAILTQNHEMHGILARYSSACCATVRYAILTQNVEWDPKWCAVLFLELIVTYFKVNLIFIFIIVKNEGQD